MRMLFWDIDGTLLHTGGAGLEAWRESLLEALGDAGALDGFRTSGLTDPEIARALAEEQPARDRDLADRLLRGYTERLAARLRPGDGRVMPNVPEVLAEASRRGGWESALLTGNVAAGGRAKLRHFGLLDYFPWGAFSDGTRSRTEVAERALAGARARHGGALRAVYVIGDTPHDVACGKAIGAITIAVATGDYPAEELSRCEPSLTLEALPEPEAFFGRLEDAAGA